MLDKKKLSIWLASVACSVLAIIFLKTMKDGFPPKQGGQQNIAVKEIAASRVQEQKTDKTKGSTTIVGQVVGVHDGDTLTLRTEEETIKVRLAGIDTPELGQPFGSNAKQALSAVAFGKTATIKSSSKDRYGRTLGHVFVDDQAINTMLVRTGMAWHYRQYDKTKELEDAERYAKENKIGLWAEKTPIAPWDWRKGTR
jgi:endonuclease YncB( thermonuclease family)